MEITNPSARNSPDHYRSLITYLPRRSPATVRRRRAWRAVVPQRRDAGGSLLTLLIFALCCFALCSALQAVTPAPDGGYPGGNTAEGQSALLSLTTGGFNTVVGYFSLRSDTTGQLNTALGAGALLANTGDSNTATGAGALLSNTTGFQNAANGAFALSGNTTGSYNTATGYQALYSNTAGSNNTAIGHDALLSNTFANANTAIGGEALANNTSGSQNTANGQQALHNNTTGTLNIALGFNAGSNVTTANNVICIGTDGNNVDNSCYIGQIFGATSSGGTAVFVNSNGRLGTTTSSRRFKEEIKPMESASDALFALKPVTFRYKKGIDPQGIPQFGLVAEDVEAVNPDLVVRDDKQQLYSVRYEAVNAMLLNEFLKEHRKVEKLTKDFQATVVQQQNEIQALTAQLKEQAAQIQKVSAQLAAYSFTGLAVRKPASQTVFNNQ